MPEQPDWTQTDSSAVSEGATEPAQPPSAAPVSGADSTPASSAGPLQAEMPAPTPSTSITATAPSPAPADTPEIGVPNPGNYDLPWFNDYGRSFFERQGLKFRAGPLNLRMSLTTSVEYNDNIFGTSVNPVADDILHISPSFSLTTNAGATKDFFTLSYHPSLNYYQTQSQQNNVSQNLEIDGQASFSRYSTKVSLAYSTSNSPNATQNGGQSYSTLNFDWENRYDLGAKTFAQAVVNSVIQSSQSSNNYQTFSLSPQLGYTYSPKTTLSFGPVVGIAYVGNGGSQTFQGLTVGIEYSNLRKLTFGGNFGVQARQFHGLDSTGASNFMTPVFNLGATYAVGVNTNIQLQLVRDVELSDFQQGLTYTTSGVTLQLSQKIFQRIAFNLNVGYQLLDYQGNSDLGRTDQYISFTPSVSYSFWKEAFSVSISYQRQQRTSDVEQFQYNVNSYVVGITYHF